MAIEELSSSARGGADEVVGIRSLPEAKQCWGHLTYLLLSKCWTKTTRTFCKVTLKDNDSITSWNDKLISTWFYCTQSNVRCISFLCYRTMCYAGFISSLLWVCSKLFQRMFCSMLWCSKTASNWAASPDPVSDFCIMLSKGNLKGWHRLQGNVAHVSKCFWICLKMFNCFWFHVQCVPSKQALWWHVNKLQFKAVFILGIFRYFSCL